MSKIEFLNTIGKLKLNDEGKIEEHNLGRGTFAIIEKEDFLLAHFFAESQYRRFHEDGTYSDYGGPILEVLSKVPHYPSEDKELYFKVPNFEDCKDLWEEVYQTAYYNGLHQKMLNTTIKITKQNTAYRIDFYAEPEDDCVIIEGYCTLTLKDKIDRFW